MSFIRVLALCLLATSARSAFGGKFSLPGFRDVVLQTGSVALDVLAEVVDPWIATQR